MWSSFTFMRLGVEGKAAYWTSCLRLSNKGIWSPLVSTSSGGSRLVHAARVARTRYSLEYLAHDVHVVLTAVVRVIVFFSATKDAKSSHFSGKKAAIGSVLDAIARVTVGMKHGHIGSARGQVIYDSDGIWMSFWVDTAYRRVEHYRESVQDTSILDHGRVKKMFWPNW